MISRVLVSSVMKTTPLNVCFQRITTPLLVSHATSFLPYFTAACRSRMLLKRLLRRFRPCAEERISTRLVVEVTVSVSLITHERERAQ